MLNILLTILFVLFVSLTVYSGPSRDDSSIRTISAKIIRSKINLSTRLLHGQTTTFPLMKMLENPVFPGTFVADIRYVTQALNIDLFRECLPIDIELPVLVDELHNRLFSFLNNWSDSHSSPVNLLPHPYPSVRCAN